jgi:hypothetical protein
VATPREKGTAPKAKAATESFGRQRAALRSLANRGWRHRQERGGLFGGEELRGVALAESGNILFEFVYSREQIADCGGQAQQIREALGEATVQVYDARRPQGREPEDVLCQSAQDGCWRAHEAGGAGDRVDRDN